MNLFFCPSSADGTIIIIIIQHTVHRSRGGCGPGVRAVVNTRHSRPLLILGVLVDGPYRRPSRVDRCGRSHSSVAATVLRRRGSVLSHHHPSPDPRRMPGRLLPVHGRLFLFVGFVVVVVDTGRSGRGRPPFVNGRRRQHRPLADHGPRGQSRRPP